MACTSCQQSAQAKRQARAIAVDLPLLATDIQVIHANEVRPLAPSDWPEDKHKLLVLYPQTFTPVCGSELGAINQWLEPFAALDCQLIAVCSDPAPAIADWYRQEPLLSDLGCLTFSSYLLPARLGLVEQGRVKRASVFLMQDGAVVKQEHFKDVGRSFAELHRMLYGYSTRSYCAEGWQSPADGFLQAANAENVQ